MLAVTSPIWWRGRLTRTHVAERVAPRSIGRSATHEMVAFVGGDHEQRIVASNAVLRQSLEERTERIVVGRQLSHVVGFPWP
jgi:hypothetical protein